MPLLAYGWLKLQNYFTTFLVRRLEQWKKKKSNGPVGQPTVGHVAVWKGVEVDVEDLVLDVAEESVPERVEEVQRLWIAAYNEMSTFCRKAAK